jgi:peptidyl-prolyl cis-trans isomerase SurA
VAVFAALGAGEIIDRIAAVVNDEIILLSEVDEKIFLLQAQGQLAGRDSSEVGRIRRDILDRLIEERLVVQRARSQGIEVDASEVLAAVDEAIARVQTQFPDPAAFEAALESEGLSLSQLRERYETDVRQERLAQRIVGREIRSQVDVTTDDVQRYFNENKDTLPRKPDEVRLSHLVVEPVDAAEMQAARDRIDRVWQALASGEPLDRARGDLPAGDLGRFRAGDLAPEIDAVLDTLPIGVYSRPVRSLQGFHLFRIGERDGDAMELSHVLSPIRMSEEDVARARGEAEAARQRIVKGEQFSVVVLDVSDDALTRESGGDLGWAEVENLLSEVTAALDTLAVGGISPVIRSDRGFHVFRLVERREGGQYAFEEIRERLHQLIESQELEKAYDEWLAAVRDSAYVEVKAWTR